MTAELDLLTVSGAKRLRAISSGRRKNPLYGVYTNMLTRCYNTRNHAYINYGGRGIAVCDRWRGIKGFDNFVADMGERPLGYTLERVNNDVGYGPDNCCWADNFTQSQNRRMPKNNTSGYKWVYFDPITEMYRGRAVIDGKKKSAGFFKTAEDAYRAVLLLKLGRA